MTGGSDHGAHRLNRQLLVPPTDTSISIGCAYERKPNQMRLSVSAPSEIPSLAPADVQVQEPAAWEG